MKLPVPLIRVVLAGVAAVALAIVLTMGLRGQKSTQPPLQPFDDMVEQPKYKAQAESPFFADGRTMRLPPAHTIAFGRNTVAPDARLTVTDEQLFALKQLPLPLDRNLLRKGRKTFETYCMVCHGATGTGNGIAVAYNLTQPTSYHVDRLVKETTDGQLFQTITQGKGKMASYAERISREDRWAVVAYLRALQRAQRGTLSDVPEAARKELDAP